MLSYDQAAAKKQWREAVRAVAEAIEDAGGVVNNVNEARLDAVEAWIGESRQWLLAGLRQGRIDVAKANRAMWAADELLYRIERVILKLGDPDSYCPRHHRDSHRKNVRRSNGIWESCSDMEHARMSQCLRRLV